MGTKDALGDSKLLTFALMLGGLWVLLVALDTIGTVQSGFATGRAFGATPLGGLAGLVVMAVLLGLAVWLYGELSGGEAGPSTWPPE